MACLVFPYQGIERVAKENGCVGTHFKWRLRNRQRAPKNGNYEDERFHQQKCTSFRNAIEVVPALFHGNHFSGMLGIKSSLVVRGKSA
jgi:hypothetical protein